MPINCSPNFGRIQRQEETHKGLNFKTSLKFRPMVGRRKLTPEKYIHVSARAMSRVSVRNEIFVLGHL